MLDYTEEVLKTWVKHSIKNLKLISFFILLEFWTVWISCINSILRLLLVYQGKDNLNTVDERGLSKLSALNPLNYLHEIIMLEKTRIIDCMPEECALSNENIFKIGGGVTLMLIIHHLTSFIIFRISEYAYYKFSRSFLKKFGYFLHLHVYQ